MVDIHWLVTHPSSQTWPHLLNSSVWFARLTHTHTHTRTHTNTHTHTGPFVLACNPLALAHTHPPYAPFSSPFSPQYHSFLNNSKLHFNDININHTELWALCHQKLQVALNITHHTHTNTHTRFAACVCSVEAVGTGLTLLALCSTPPWSTDPAGESADPVRGAPEESTRRRCTRNPGPWNKAHTTEDVCKCL